MTGGASTLAFSFFGFFSLVSYFLTLSKGDIESFEASTNLSFLDFFSFFLSFPCLLESLLIWFMSFTIALIFEFIYSPIFLSFSSNLFEFLFSASCIEAISLLWSFFYLSFSFSSKLSSFVLILSRISETSSAFSSSALYIFLEYSLSSVALRNLILSRISYFRDNWFCINLSLYSRIVRMATNLCSEIPRSSSNLVS